MSEEIDKLRREIRVIDKKLEEKDLPSLPIPPSPVEVPESEKKKEKGKTWHQNLFKKEKFKKPSKVGVLFLRKNGTAEAMEKEPKNSFFEVDGQTYHERRDCTYFFGKDRIPLAVISEGGFIPLGTTKWYEKDMLSKFHEAQDHLLRGIRHAELVRVGGMGVSPNVKKMIGIGLLVLIGLVILFNYI
jgi:hypothetical protein